MTDKEWKELCEWVRQYKFRTQLLYDEPSINIFDNTISIKICKNSFLNLCINSRGKIFFLNSLMQTVESAFPREYRPEQIKAIIENLL